MSDTYIPSIAGGEIPIDDLIKKKNLITGITDDTNLVLSINPINPRAIDIADDIRIYYSNINSIVTIPAGTIVMPDIYFDNLTGDEAAPYFLYINSDGTLIWENGRNPIRRETSICRICDLSIQNSGIFALRKIPYIGSNSNSDRGRGISYVASMSTVLGLDPTNPNRFELESGNIEIWLEGIGHGTDELNQTIVIADSPTTMTSVYENAAGDELIIEGRNLTSILKAYNNSGILTQTANNKWAYYLLLYNVAGFFVLRYGNTQTNALLLRDEVIDDKNNIFGSVDTTASDIAIICINEAYDGIDQSKQTVYSFQSSISTSITTGSDVVIESDGVIVKANPKVINCESGLVAEVSTGNPEKVNLFSDFFVQIPDGIKNKTPGTTELSAEKKQIVLKNVVDDKQFEIEQQENFCALDARGVGNTLRIMNEGATKIFINFIAGEPKVSIGYVAQIRDETLSVNGDMSVAGNIENGGVPILVGHVSSGGAITILTNGTGGTVTCARTATGVYQINTTGSFGSRFCGFAQVSGFTAGGIYNAGLSRDSSTQYRVSLQIFRTSTALDQVNREFSVILFK